MPILQRNARLDARGWKIRMQSLFLKLKTTKDMCQKSVAEFAKSAIKQGSTIHADGYCSYKKACLVMNISRKFTIRTQVCCIGCMWWLAMQRLLYLEHFTDCPRRISTSTCRNSALGSTVETWICLNAWLSRFVAHFYLTKRDNQIIKEPRLREAILVQLQTALLFCQREFFLQYRL